MPTTHLLAFVLPASVLAVASGPSVLFVVSRLVVLGRGAGLGTAAGDGLGAIAQLVVVSLGVGVVLEQSIVVFNVVKLAGAA